MFWLGLISGIVITVLTLFFWCAFQLDRNGF